MSARLAVWKSVFAVSVAAISATLALGLLAPAAGAATVVNGDFETGSLVGWTQANSFKFPEEEVGGWFAYSGTVPPVSGEGPEEGQLIAPPQGNFAATSDENGPGTHILYQDIPLEAGMTHSLSMLVYYKSAAPIVVPSPDTLSFGKPVSLEEAEEEIIEEDPPNQQYRIDVMNPAAPIESVNPADILATVFRTLPGAPQTMQPTPVTVDLTPFAGQTVRLRLAEVDNQFFFNAGADSIVINSVPRNDFKIGKLKLNKKSGTAKLFIDAPGPGQIVIDDAGSVQASAAAKKLKDKLKKKKVAVAAAGSVAVPVVPTRAAKKVLRKKGKLRFRASVTFIPTGGAPATQKRSGKLKIKRRPKRHSRKRG